MILFKKFTSVATISKIIAIVLLLILLLIGLILSIKYQERNATNTRVLQNQNQITKIQAEEIVRNLPEVKNFLKILSDNKSGLFIHAEDGKNNLWTVQVAEVVEDSKVDGKYVSHTATFNWYEIEKSTGRINSSMYQYDKKGDLMKPLKDHL